MLTNTPTCSNNTKNIGQRLSRRGFPQWLSARRDENASSRLPSTHPSLLGVGNRLQNTCSGWSTEYLAILHTFLGIERR